MPKTPKGAKRPADVISNAVHVMKIATGEIEELPKTRGVAGGVKGGRARAQVLTATRRLEIAQRAAKARWKKA
jgi:hypothetical protein